MTNVERARRWIEDRDLGRATVESDVASLVMQFDKVRDEASLRADLIGVIPQECDCNVCHRLRALLRPSSQEKPET